VIDAPVAVVRVGRQGAGTPGGRRWRPTGAAGRELVLAPRWRFVAPGRLTPRLSAALGDAAGAPSLGGVLVPRYRSEDEPLVFGRNLGRLLESLVRPGTLAPAVARRLGPSAGDLVAGLVLDGLVAIREHDAWVSGAAAFDLVGARVPPSLTQGRTARLSLAALRYGALLDGCGASTISARLYRFHSLPTSARWRRALPSDEEVLGWFEDEGRKGDEAWVRADRSEGASGWLSWRRRRARRGPGQGTPVFKLYVSPASDALRLVLPVLREELAASGAFALKVGAGIHGLLRPDKIVAYFPDHRSLVAAARALAPGLRGVPAHGVPFTASLVPSGLLSWGIDPASVDLPPGLERRGSWRFWICARAATALVEARRAERLPVSPWRFALARLALEGIEIRSFAPRGPWRDRGAGARRRG
jgi:hypothetical protein